MKRTISILSALALVFVLSSNAFSQAASTTINASADIVSSLEFTTETNLSFGSIPSNFSGVVLSPSDDGSGGTDNDSNTGTGSQLGEVVIDSGSGSQSLLVTINSPSTLTSTTTPTNIEFISDYVGEDGTDLSSASDASITTTDTGDGNFDYAIYFGGSLNDPGNGSTDASLDTEPHTGTITINIDYSS